MLLVPLRLRLKNLMPRFVLPMSINGCVWGAESIVVIKYSDKVILQKLLLRRKLQSVMVLSGLVAW